MGGRRFDIRLAVGSPNGPRSSVWAIWARNSEVYATHRGMGGVEKFSFHTPTVCRHAITREHATVIGMSNRAMQVWHRDSTLPAGDNKVVRVLRIGVATDHLSTKLENTAPQKTRWITPAPSGGSTIIDLFFTQEDEATLREALATEPTGLNHELLGYRKLPNGEAVSISTWHSDTGDRVLRMKAAPHDPRDLLVLPCDPENTGRPVRLTLFSKPKDGELMTVWEMGGYWHAPLTDAQWEAMSAPYKST